MREKAEGKDKLSPIARSMKQRRSERLDAEREKYEAVVSRMTLRELQRIALEPSGDALHRMVRSRLVTLQTAFKKNAHSKGKLTKKLTNNPLKTKSPDVM